MTRNVADDASNPDKTTMVGADKFVIVDTETAPDSLKEITKTNAFTSPTIVTPTIASFANATHNHSNAAGGGATLTSPTITTPTIADFTNATHDHGDADDGGSTLLPSILTLTSTTATLSSDAFTFSSSLMVIDTEGAAATDNCSTINSGSATNGTILIVRQANSGRDITWVDGSPLRIAGNCVFTTTNDTLTLLMIGPNVWCELCRSING